MTAIARLMRDALRESRAHNCICETCVYYSEFGVCNCHDVYDVSKHATCPQWVSESVVMYRRKQRIDTPGVKVGSKDMDDIMF